MPKTRLPVYIPVLFLLYIIFILYSLRTPCAALEGARFRTVEEKTEAVVLPDSDSSHPQPGIFRTYRPTLAFNKGTYHWSYSDMFITGSYECSAGVIRASPAWAGGSTIRAEYDTLSGTLFWDGARYQYTSQSLLRYVKYLIVFVIAILVIEFFRTGWF